MRRNFLTFLMGFIITFTFFSVNVKKIKNYKTGDSKDIIRYNTSDIKSYIKKEFYSSYNVLSINLKEDEEKKIIINDCHNFDQGTLNKYYNFQRKDSEKSNIDSTCSVVAAVSTVMFYDDYDNLYRIDNNGQNEFFCDLMDEALKKKYTTRTNGTENGMLNNLLSLAYDEANSARYGNTEWYHIKKKLNKSLNKNVPEMFSLTDHSIVVCGVTTFNYTITYKTTNNKQKVINETKEAYIVNEGWGYKTRSIVFKSKIGNITDGHVLTISARG